MNVDEMVEANAALRLLANEYTNHGFEVPEWLPERGRDLQRALAMKLADSLAAQLGAAKLRQRKDRSLEERRAENAEEIAALEARLANLKAG